MQHQSPQQWFFHQLAKESFVIYTITWLCLFFLENLKEGIVSNYLSLSHSLLPLFCIGILWLAVSPDQPAQEKDVSVFPFMPMLVLSIFVVVVLVLILEATMVLTTLVIFATLAAIWAGSHAYYKQQ